MAPLDPHLPSQPQPLFFPPQPQPPPQEQPELGAQLGRPGILFMLSAPFDSWRSNQIVVRFRPFDLLIIHDAELCWPKANCCSVG
jgi:hypothetical protein